MSHYFGKRFGDIFFALIALILLSPVFLLTITSMLIFENGPIFFTQKRVGKNNKEFIIIKFRSLPINTPNLPSDKIKITQISYLGKFLRRTNIDELPQLINIIKGEMSFVGPRPALKKQQNLISERIKNGSIRCNPGLTGLAQINSYYNMPFNEKARFDGIYFKKISLFGDLIIILRTFNYLLTPPPVH